MKPARNGSTNTPQNRIGNAITVSAIRDCRSRRITNTVNTSVAAAAAAVTKSPIRASTSAWSRSRPSALPAPLVRYSLIACRVPIERSLGMTVNTEASIIALATPPTQPAMVTWRGRSSFGCSLTCLIAPCPPKPGSRCSDHLQRQRLGPVDVVDRDLLAVGDLAADQHPRQRVADGGLDEPAQRAGAVRRVVAGGGQPGARGVGDGRR